MAEMQITQEQLSAQGFYSSLSRKAAKKSKKKITLTKAQSHEGG
jgi:hypothetical protein